MSSCALISTIISTYNRPALLREALESLRQQSYRPLEIVVVDDGSEAETRQAVESWRREVAGDLGLRLRYHRQENQGPAVARNQGLSMASGDYIQFMDDDDVLDRDALFHLHAALTQEQAQAEGAVVAMAAYRQFRAGQPVGAAPLEVQQPGADSRERLGMMIRGSWFVPIHGYLFSREALARMGQWDSTLSSQEDDAYLLQAALKHVRFVPAADAVVHYRHHEWERRSVPESEQCSESQGKMARLFADLAIRESVFHSLQVRSQARLYRRDFEAWLGRLRRRYGVLLAAANLADSAVMRWLAQHDASLREKVSSSARGAVGAPAYPATTLSPATSLTPRDNSSEPRG